MTRRPAQTCVEATTKTIWMCRPLGSANLLVITYAGKLDKTLKTDTRCWDDDTLRNIRYAHVFRAVYRDSHPLQDDCPLDERRAWVSHTLSPHAFLKVDVDTQNDSTLITIQPVRTASLIVDSPCLQTETPSSQQPPRGQARALPCIRRQEDRRPSRGGGHVRRLRRTGAHRGSVRETHAKLEPHEHVAVPLLQRHPRPRLRVREQTTKDKHVHQDLRIGRCVVLASGDVLEAVRSGTAWRVTRWLQRLSARHACPQGTPTFRAVRICVRLETLGNPNTRRRYFPCLAMQHGTSSRIILYFPINLRRKLAHTPCWPKHVPRKRRRISPVARARQSHRPNPPQQP